MLQNLCPETKKKKEKKNTKTQIYKDRQVNIKACL